MTKEDKVVYVFVGFFAVFAIVISIGVLLGNSFCVAVLNGFMNPQSATQPCERSHCCECK